MLRDFVRHKSRRGTRRVPVSSTLAPYLRSHEQRTARTVERQFRLD